jgi:hypothetical protein
VRSCHLPRALFWILIAIAARSAMAAVPDAEVVALDAVKRGIKAREHGDLAGALVAFQEAQRRVPEANLPYRYAAEVLEALGRYEEAVASYERYLAVKSDVSDAPSVRARVQHLRATFLEGRLTVVCDPPGGSVLLDDAAAPIGVAPLSSVAVRPRVYTVTVALAGFARSSYRVEVLPGREAKVDCALVREAASDPSPVIAPPRTPQVAPVVIEKIGPKISPRRRALTAGAVATGVGAAVLVGAILLDTIWLGNTLADFQAAAQNGDPNAASLQSRARSLQVTAGIGYALGALLTAGGAAVLIWALRPSRIPARAALDGTIFHF